jgi:proteic killer suppression protein
MVSRIGLEPKPSPLTLAKTKKYHWLDFKMVSPFILSKQGFAGENIKEFSGIRKVAERKLTMLDSASDLKDLLAPAGNRLEKLKGDRAGQHSIRITDQWRICVLWKADGPYEVEITDYH